MREACDLPLNAPVRAKGKGSEIPKEECGKMRLVELSDALSIISIGRNCEVVINASSIDVLWKRMAHPHPVSARQGEKKAFELFNKMVDMGLWVNRGATVKGYPRYCPVVKCRGDLKDIYVCDVNDGSMEYPEMVNREALKIYASSDARWKNNTAIRDLDNLFLLRIVGE